MWTLAYFLIATGVVLLAVRALRSLPPPPLAASEPAPPPRSAPSAAAPQPSALAWDGAPVVPPQPLAGERLRDRLRDRYIAARFPGLAESVEDLMLTDEVIRAARLCFQEEQHDLGQELLELAIERSPANEELRLAQIELAFLTRSRTRFVALARAFREAIPDSRNWNEIARLGRALAPSEPIFAAGPGSRPHEHYGPWPDLPNWIGASWDLTPEVLAADFRRAALAATRIQTPERRRFA